MSGASSMIQRKIAEQTAKLMSQQSMDSNASSSLLSQPKRQFGLQNKIGSCHNLLLNNQAAAPTAANPYMQRTKLVNSLNRSFRSDTKVGTYERKMTDSDAKTPGTAPNYNENSDLFSF